MTVNIRKKWRKVMGINFQIRFRRLYQSYVHFKI